MTWSAAQYTQFEAERTRPVRDLLAAVQVQDARTVVDIGCGPGNSTDLLAMRYPEAAVFGFDSSEDMLVAARERLPTLRFELLDVTDWTDLGPFDVILANAVFQWVPDHEHLFPNLLAKLRPGGCLAVQMPDTLEEPAHVLMRQVASIGPWAGKLAVASRARTDRHDANWYYRLLHGSCARLDLWQTTYFHQLAGGPAAIVEWFKGSGLRPFLEPLEPDERSEFLARYLEAIERAYPAEADGSVLLPFPRLFIVATA
ncbi:trans-aconitate 2-methyltransferase [soil metagenome]